jgi:hypothetical protein
VVADGAPATLVDLDLRNVVTQIPSKLGTARPCFRRLPDGREVLFVAAPNYMDVRVLDPTSGDDVRFHDHGEREYFCHVDFRLALDARRLARHPVRRNAVDERLS